MLYPLKYEFTTIIDSTKLFCCFNESFYFAAMKKKTKLLDIEGIKTVTAHEFAEMIGVSPQAVTASLRRDKPHENVISYEKWGRQWRLEVKQVIPKK